jgi:hypothetical protein
MDQGSGFISDFRAKRIRTQITWEIYWQTVTRLLRRIRLMRVDGPVPEPVVATRVTKPWRMGEWSRIEFPGINSPGQAPVEHARGFSGSRMRLLWSTHLCGARTRLQTRLQAPITARERCHVTQPRARINVSCSRVGHKGAGGTTRRVLQRTSNDEILNVPH